MARLRFAALAVLLFAGLCATALAIWSRSGANTTTKVSVDKVARAAHQQTAAHEAPGLRPAPGTYAYRVSGTESVSALGGSKHHFGPEVPAVVALHGSGCEWSINFIYAEEHNVTYTYCTDHGGTRLLETNTTVKFFGHEEIVDQKCAGAADWIVPAGAKPVGALTGFSCANDQRTTTHVPTILAPTNPPTVDGIDSAKLTLVKDDIVVGGSAHGTNPIQAWFAPSGLPVQIHELSTVKSGSILGNTDYTLDINAQLMSATPK